MRFYPASTFGQDVIGEPNYRALRDAFAEAGTGNWVLMPPYPYSPNEALLDLPGFPPHAPSWAHPFGTDDRGRDVLVRLAYGFNISLTFAILVLMIGDGIGIVVGAMLGYIAGKIDLIGQRLIEIWSSLPFLYTIIIVSSIVVPVYVPGRMQVLQPSFLLLIVILSAFEWMGDHVLHPRRVLSREGEGLRRRGDRHRRLRAGHHVPAHPAERADAGRLICAVHDRRQYLRAGRARLSRLWPPGADAKLGRADRAGDEQSHELVAGLLSARRPLPDAPSRRVHRRGRAGSVRSQGILQAPMSTGEPLLQIRGLRTHFFTESGVAKAVDGVDLDIRAGEVLGLVGESGSGKSVTALSILRLIPDPPGRIVAGEILFRGTKPARAAVGRRSERSAAGRSA